MKRRPSAATVIALLALFVALGGPAEAARFVDRITSADIKDGSVKERDLSRRTVRSLKATPNNSITEVKLANSAVTRDKLAPNAVSGAAIADRTVGNADLAIGAVTGTSIADGSLTARELGRFYGRFQLKDPIPMLGGGDCWSGVPSGLAPERAGVDISQDLVLVTPDASWPHEHLTLTVKAEATQPKRGRFVLAACNVGGGNTAAFRPSFSYLIVDLP